MIEWGNGWGCIGYCQGVGVGGASQVYLSHAPNIMFVYINLLHDSTGGESRGYPGVHTLWINPLRPTNYRAHPVEHVEGLPVFAVWFSSRACDRDDCTVHSSRVWSLQHVTAHYHHWTSSTGEHLHACIYMYIHVCICMYIHVCICMYIHVCNYNCI